MLPVQDAREAVLWLAVHHKHKKALEVFSREIAPAGTGMGTTVTLTLSSGFKFQARANKFLLQKFETPFNICSSFLEHSNAAPLTLYHVTFVSLLAAPGLCGIVGGRPRV